MTLLLKDVRSSHVMVFSSVLIAQLLLQGLTNSINSNYLGKLKDSLQSVKYLSDLYNFNLYNMILNSFLTALESTMLLL